MNSTLSKLLRACLAVAALYLPVPAAHASQFCSRMDFNGDAKSDFLWRNGASGSNYVYLLNGTAQLKNSGYTNTVPDTSWNVAAVGDFDGDGNADILWRRNTGENYVFLMNGTTVAAGSNYINSVTVPGWRVAGIGDFDGDGKDDILWRNISTGENFIFFMNGTTVKSTSGYTNTVPDQNWQIAGIGDFDGDGRSDILWRNAGSGEDYIFFMNGTQVLSTSGPTNAVPDTDWNVAGVADFNGDGKADVLWRNAKTGEDYVFFMNGSAVLGSSDYTNTVPDMNWQVSGVGDYNNDGNADILWHNASDGQNYLFLMNGVQVLSDSNYTAPVPDTSWAPVPAATMVGTTSKCGTISLSAVPSRVSGIAPLTVFFDASGTTAVGISKPYHDIEYRWNFGDPASGTWSYGIRPGTNSRNAATGPISAHVYESPGTYTITLTAADGLHTAKTTLQVTVQDPNSYYSGSNTICVSTGADFTGCPAGAAQQTQASWSTVKSYIATGKRILLRRGDTWDASSSGNITVNGPWTLGAFGSGPKPTIRAVADGVTLIPQGTGTGVRLSDVRIMDLNLVGNGHASVMGIAYSGSRTYDEMTILRTDISGVYHGLQLGAQDQVGVADSTVTSSGYTEYAWGPLTRSAFLGNKWTETATTDQGEGSFRVEGHVGLVVSNNDFAGFQTGRPQLKINSAQGNSDKSVFSDNIMTGGSGAFPIDFAPQNNYSDERITNFIFERNWMRYATSTFRFISISARKGTIRNNIFDMSNVNTQITNEGIRVEQLGVEPAPDDIQIYNNTFYSSSAVNLNGDRMIAINLRTGTNIVVKNNLASFPNSPNNDAVLVDSATGTVKANNTLTDTPGWVSASPAVPTDYRLAPGSAAIDSGAPAPVQSDFFLLRRPQNDGIDRGAAEYGP